MRFVGKLLTVSFAAIFLWFVFAFYYDIVEVDELSFTMLIVQLKWLYWIGPLGASQFLLTAIVQLIRFCRDPLAADDVADRRCPLEFPPRSKLGGPASGGWTARREPT